MPSGDPADLAGFVGQRYRNQSVQVRQAGSLRAPGDPELPVDVREIELDRLLPHWRLDSYERSSFARHP
jgi:hypothetical protein